MITEDIYNYLCADETLQTALSANETDSKIYPNFAAITSRTPYIVYRSYNPGGCYDEVLCEEHLTFIITAENFAQTAAISKILTVLLDLTSGQIPSQDYRIYYSKKIGGSDFIDELGRHSRAVNFIFKFK